MEEFIKMTGRKTQSRIIRTEQNRPEQNRTEIAEVRDLFHLIMFIKLVFGHDNIVCSGILFLLIVKTNSFAIF